MNTANLTFEIRKIRVVQDLPESIQILIDLSRLIDQHFTQHRSPAFYAVALSINELRLNRYCKMVLDKTVYELIQDRVHHKAVNLLITTDWSIKRIAYEVGCGDPCYFNRCFKKKTGTTPKKFRLSGLRKDFFSIQTIE